VLTAPEVLIAGKAARLAPGARIRGENNLLLMPGELAGAFACWCITPRRATAWSKDSLGAERRRARQQGLAEHARTGRTVALRRGHPDLEPAMSASTTKKVFIKTFGCQMNEYDSDKMADVMRAAEGFEKTDDPEAADLIVFNTCSVREKAQEKVFSDLGRVRHLKAKGVQIGVGGCVASQEGAAIIERAPFVDVVFGPQTLHRLPELLDKRRRRTAAGRHLLPRDREVRSPAAGQGRGPQAFVSIMEGCSKYCSYCVVPYTRGEEVSRPLRRRADRDRRPGRPGRARGHAAGPERQRLPGCAWAAATKGEIADFALLIEYVAEIPGIRRIRYTTSHPNEFTQRLIDVYAKVPQLVNHLHLPVQHGADRILAAMKRGYTALQYKSIVRRLRAVRPDIRMATDFIVGFPGETDEDHAKTMRLIEEVGFDASFSFIFSPRPGTPAANLPDDTPYE
jgi:tRNA-2-methylthio-N6-dimethylallyladenosine synthase